MTEGNGRIEEGMFRGKVLEALETLKIQQTEFTRLIALMQKNDDIAHQRIVDVVEKRLEARDLTVNSIVEELSEHRSATRVTAAKVAGLFMLVWAVLQGGFIWLSK
jgi:hypothetical protein